MTLIYKIFSQKMQISGKKTAATEISGIKIQKPASYKIFNSNVLQFQLRITPNKENKFTF